LNYQRGSLLSIDFGTIVVFAGTSHAKDGTLRGIPQACPEPFRSEVRPMHKVSDSIRSTHGQDGAIVLDIAQGKIYRLNRVGSRVLESLETGTNETDIADRISREFGVSYEVAESDTGEFIQQLQRMGLLA
jgi:coenzyme PQQ synthesis protein D (PqqD)